MPRASARARPRRALPPAILRQLYLRDGLSPRAIGQRLGLGETAVRRRLIALGLPLRGRAEAIRLARCPGVTRAALEQLYCGEQLSQVETARRLGCSPDTIRAALQRLGIARRPASEAARLARGVNIPAADLRRLYERDGLSLEAIARRYGCSASAVRSRMAASGIPRRSPWETQAAGLSPEGLRRLYLEEGRTLAEIARQFGCSASTVSRHLKRSGIPARPPGAPVHPRADFSRDPDEAAYLIGFRLGDLAVFEEGRTIVVSTSTTQQSQLDLLHRLFGRYGHVYEFREPGRRVHVQCRLNQTFRFLLPKDDRVPEWILLQDETFWAFLAGYTDAEGSFQLIPRFILRTTDFNLLHTCWQQLARRGIRCPPPRRAVRAGYTNKAGIVSRKDQWDLALHRRSALAELIACLWPHLKHAKRRDDCARVWKLVHK